ncbi:MAG: hypothetical protein ACLQLC_21080 [Candidatus Sulfotelmatobacter sp.]
MNPWITYRTRFLVKAKQLTTSLAFTDVLGRQHSGRKGDYLVESSDGILRIAPRQIFEDIYVPLADAHDETSTPPTARVLYDAFAEDELPHDETSSSLPCPAELFSNKPSPTGSSRSRKTAAVSIPPHLTRKSPQPYRNGRGSSPGLHSL